MTRLYQGSSFALPAPRGRSPRGHAARPFIPAPPGGLPTASPLSPARPPQPRRRHLRAAGFVPPRRQQRAPVGVTPPASPHQRPPTPRARRRGGGWTRGRPRPGAQGEESRLGPDRPLCACAGGGSGGGGREPPARTHR